MRRIDRFDNYLFYKGLNDNIVTNDLHLSIGTIGKSRKEGRDLSDRVVELILNFYTDLSRVWLLTGEGEMLTSTSASTDEMVDVSVISQNDEIEVDIDSLMRTWHTTPENFAKIIGESVDFVRACNNMLLPRHIIALQQFYGDAVIDRYAKYPKQYKATIKGEEQLKKTVVLTPDVIRNPELDIREAYKAGELDEYAKPTQDIIPSHNFKAYTYCDDMEPEIRAGEPVLVRLLPIGVAITPGEMYYIDLPRGSKIRYIDKEENGKLYLKARNSAYGDIVVDRSEVQSLAEVVVILRTPRSMSNKESTLAEMMLRKDEHLSDMLANNNKLIDELCKQNERTGRMIDKLIEK